jgi:uncharacterized protein (DUF4415 family)
MDKEQIIKRKRGQRGLGKEPAMVHVSLRISIETLEFFKRSGWGRPAMRQALLEFMEKHS